MTNHIRANYDEGTDPVIILLSEDAADVFLDLWLIVEKYFNDFFEISGFTGLCEMFDEMEKTGIIERYEEEYLAGKIELELKQNNSYFPFLWPIYQKEPRAQFIQNQILKSIRNFG